MGVVLDDHIEWILWTEEEISIRVSKLASQISVNFKEFPSPDMLVGVATGALWFLADLTRKIKLPISVDLIRVESYESGTESNGSRRIFSDIKLDVEGKHVILVEDIADTRNTLSGLIPQIPAKGAASLSF